MRLLFLCVLAASAAFTEEPDPMNDEERTDEAAQSHRRTKWIACMTLARALVVEHELELSPILNRSKHDKEATRKKIIADILSKCSSQVTLAEAHDILTEDNLDIVSDKYEDYLGIDEAQFLDPEKDIGLTAEQVALYEAIKRVGGMQEATSTEESFDKELPVVEYLSEPPAEKPVQPAEELDYQLMGIVAACNVGLLGIVICER